jgi:hypothetical protein
MRHWTRSTRPIQLNLDALEADQPKARNKKITMPQKQISQAYNLKEKIKKRKKTSEGMAKINLETN